MAVVGEGGGEGVSGGGYGGLFWGDDNVLERGGGGGCTTQKMYKMPQSCSLKVANFSKTVKRSVAGGAVGGEQVEPREVWGREDPAGPAMPPWCRTRAPTHSAYNTKAPSASLPIHPLRHCAQRCRGGSRASGWPVFGKSLHLLLSFAQSLKLLRKIKSFKKND